MPPLTGAAVVAGHRGRSRTTVPHVSVVVAAGNCDTREPVFECSSPEEVRFSWISPWIAADYSHGVTSHSCIHSNRWLLAGLEWVGQQSDKLPQSGATTNIRVLAPRLAVSSPSAIVRMSCGV